MNRLTRWNNKTEQPELVDWDKEEWKEFMETFDVSVKMNLISAFKKLAYYEDLEEQGLLVKLPCRVGDEVWTNESEGKQFCGTITFITIMNSRDDMGGGFINVAFNNGHSLMQFDFSDIGKTVFLTKAEAEKALEEMEK